MLDIVTPSTDSEEELRKQDIKSLGELLIDLATKTPNAHTDLTKHLEEIKTTYSSEFCDIIQYILQEQNLDKLVEKLAIRIMNEMTQLHE